MADELVGATILAVEEREGDWRGDFTRLHVRYRDGLAVNEQAEGFYEIWQDEEGNGPGALALVGHTREEVDVQEEKAMS